MIKDHGKDSYTIFFHPQKWKLYSSPIYFLHREISQAKLWKFYKHYRDSWTREYPVIYTLWCIYYVPTSNGLVKGRSTPVRKELFSNSLTIWWKMFFQYGSGRAVSIRAMAFIQAVMLFLGIMCFLVTSRSFISHGNVWSSGKACWQNI